MTVIVDLTHRPTRLVDIVLGRSAEVFADWLKDQSDDFRACIDHVAMDAFAGYKKAATDVLPQATVVMDSFHVVALVGALMKRGVNSRQNFTAAEAGPVMTCMGFGKRFKPWRAAHQ